MNSERISPFWVNGYQPFSALTGSYVEKDNTFLFSKGSYRYVVTMGDKATLKVQHNGKTILQQTQEAEE